MSQNEDYGTGIHEKRTTIDISVYISYFRKTIFSHQLIFHNISNLYLEI